MIIDRICEVCREVFGQTDTAKWGNNEPPFETICPSCTATPGPEGPQIPSATFRPREGITCPGLLLDFFWSSDAEALAWIRQHVSTEGWPDEACTKEPPKTDTPTPPALLTPEQFAHDVEYGLTARYRSQGDEEIAFAEMTRLKAHDAALREEVRQTNEYLATAEGERAALLQDLVVAVDMARTFRDLCGDNHLDGAFHGITHPDYVSVLEEYNALSEKLFALEKRNDIAAGMALLAGEGEAGHVE